MTMFFTQALIALGLFFIIDMIWLGVIAKKFYRDQLQEKMTDSFNWPAAILFYVIFILGLTFFVIAPNVVTRSVQQALYHGGFFGLICYATYDLTNLATLKNWPLKMTIIDMIWGTILGASVSGLTVWLTIMLFS